MSRRTEQIASVLHRQIQQVLVRGLSDPRLESMITVTAVRVCDDLSEAVVSVSVIPESKQDLTLHGLTAAAGHIRREAGKGMDIRRVPRLIFRLDKQIKREASILSAIAQVEQEIAQHTDEQDESNTPHTPQPAPEGDHS